MLKVYGAKWCPHCVKTTAHLKKKNIEFEYIEIEEQPEQVIQKIIEVNGGQDWVVPTLEFKGKFREGKEYDSLLLDMDLRALGLDI